MGRRALSERLLLSLFATLWCSAAWADDRGAVLYRDKCARCHGQQGEGSEDYDKPLVGDRSVAQLARYIAKSMPDDDPGSVPKDEAEAIAAHMHEAFYSPLAQARNKPPRNELAHLTVRQYRNTLADLLGSFREAPGDWGNERGLKAEYYKKRDFRDDNRVLQRVDATVDFDFGDRSPEPEKLEPHEFSIRWQGAVLAPETGEYEFTVETDHAARLWINERDRKSPLIDAWVKSGNETTYHGSIYLLGGRAYALRLEFSKAKQGVNDSDKQKQAPPSKPAMVRLKWKPPGGVVETIPARLLSTSRFPEVFVLKTQFPPDDRSMGYERGTSISKEWEQATTDAAIEVAAYVDANLNALAITSDGDGDRAQKLKQFCSTFVERAFRRPLNDEQRVFFVDRQFERAGDPREAVKRVVLLSLQSPRFLYPGAAAPPDDFAVAGRLALVLWDSLPDRDLLNDAASGQLKSRESLERHARRMLSDPRARSKVRSFFLQWLRADPPLEVTKDTKAFPDFDAALLADMRTSLELFVEEVFWSDASDFRRLLLEDEVYLNNRLARFYGQSSDGDAAFRKGKLDGGSRAGVLTHPYLMTVLSYPQATSPIHRGVFLTRGVLGRMLRPPPQAFAPLAPDLHPSLTTRERVTLQTKPEACAGCHGMINPLGFTLENYDAVGRFREQEKGKAIDPAGSYVTSSGETADFQGARALAQFLATSDEVHESFVEQLFHFMVKQPVLAFGPETPNRLKQSFRDRGYNMKELVIELSTTAAFAELSRKP